MDYETLRGNLNDVLAEVEHLSVREDLIEINEALRCTAGGYGDVYRAILRGPDSASSRVVAVKELRSVGNDATRIRMAIHLARELRVWARLKHPNVLELIGYCLNPQMTTARFISPFMVNGNIVEYLENASQPVSDDLRLKLLRDSLEGLLYLHSLSPPICHADIKPENVLVTDMVEAVLCDFGLARLTEGQPSGLTTTKGIKGSTRYMSPELLEEDAVHTLSSDIWAYGCLVLKVMTGSLPYARARSEHQVLLALMKPQQPADPSGLGLRDDGLKTLLAKCWNKSPSTRPSASECQLYLPSPISSLMCAGCDLRIVGEVVSVKARRWHPACFKCSGCGELLKHDSFYEHEGKPYCHLDYHEFVALRCYHCETPIANERFITVNDPGLDGGATRYYHELHFFCSECGDPFPHPSASSTAPKGENPHEVHHNDLGYILYRGHAYCEPCHEKLRMPKCAGCKKGVRVGDEDVRALGRSWHFYCFVCTSCKRPFEDEYPLPRGEDAYCDHCYSILVKSEL